MKAFICDACGITIKDAHVEKMKEFFVGVCIAKPVLVRRKITVHLCDDCFRGLGIIAEAKAAGRSES